MPAEKKHFSGIFNEVFSLKYADLCDIRADLNPPEGKELNVVLI